YTICREYEHLIPDAPELMQTFIDAESDAMCKCNAFVFLAHCAMSEAAEWLISVYDQLPSLGELLQMSIMIHRHHQPQYMIIGCMFELLNSSSHAVKYKAATTLTTLTLRRRLPAAKAAASCFVNLVIKESGNNVKLIVLDRLDTLHLKHDHILDGLAMDILRVLSR
ncbi:hypothetical protein EV424DRAFT_1579243, partial [Suillus variegatus]